MGDVVFYKSVGDRDWGHAAMVVNWDVQTFFGENGGSDLTNLQYGPLTPYGPNSCSEIPNKPRVVERSGMILYTGGRSIDNTYLAVNEVSIVHIK
jgi:hypothetical protein